MNQSPVSFLDFTIYWIRKILLHVFLIPDTLLSALIKPTPSARGLEGRKRLIVTIITFLKSIYQDPYFAIKGNLLRYLKQKDLYVIFSHQPSLLGPSIPWVTYNQYDFFFFLFFSFFFFFLLASQSMTQNRRLTLVTVLMPYMAALLPFVISEIPYNKGHSFYQHDK